MAGSICRWVIFLATFALGGAGCARVGAAEPCAGRFVEERACYANAVERTLWPPQERWEQQAILITLEPYAEPEWMLVLDETPDGGKVTLRSLSERLAGLTDELVCNEEAVAARGIAVEEDRKGLETSELGRLVRALSSGATMALEQLKVDSDDPPDAPDDPSTLLASVNFHPHINREPDVCAALSPPEVGEPRAKVNSLLFELRDALRMFVSVPSETDGLARERLMTKLEELERYLAEREVPNLTSLESGDRGLR